MKIINGLLEIPPISQGTVIAVGNFDGLHLGHQSIINNLCDSAKKFSLFSLVLTFYPHPINILDKNKIKMLQTLDQRIAGIKKYPVDAVWVIPFTPEFALWSSRDFITKFLVTHLNVKKIIVGENFRFGKGQEGNVEVLKELSYVYGYNIHKIPPVIKSGEIVSSSLIRQHLIEGDIEKARSLLDRPYEISGKVIKGKSLGRDLGFPTANIESENLLIPEGVFITLVNFKGRNLPAVTNVGIRPTFNTFFKNIETHIIRFKENLYNQRINLCFLQKLRDEIKFKSPEDLSLQISKDLKKAESYFSRTDLSL